jgi:hypothetical protein
MLAMPLKHVVVFGVKRRKIAILFSVLIQPLIFGMT